MPCVDEVLQRLKHRALDRAIFKVRVILAKATGTPMRSAHAAPKTYPVADQLQRWK